MDTGPPSETVATAPPSETVDTAPQRKTVDTEPPSETVATETQRKTVDTAFSFSEYLFPEINKGEKTEAVGFIKVCRNKGRERKFKLC